ncbi:probable inactive receptor kinase At1g48480 [Punica granatum]|uniref:Probable inactive receptor kinase At1g48480 n=1 Tax=Punica granatum TaxID=22663 RepID=A0A6P8EGN7_PUNGR|nr:probable inactive receptor kinase At1g48480 [Punica granatum]
MAGEKFRHENIMPLIAYGEDNDKYYLVYERMSSNLADDIAGIAQGLEHIHGKGYVHGDFKPQNILLTQGKEAKITDFGTLSRDGSRGFCNFTRGYSAPELAIGAPPTKKSDVFSFGIVLIQLLSRSMDLKRQVKRGEEKELQEWAKVLFEIAGKHVVHNNFMAVESCASEDSALALTELTINCTKKRPEGRPTMNEVIRTLNDLI